ncbi:hypothetical protein DIPPA_32878 [Diplonema papillatum]|nr:hypothetical protein DIPPA_32878 [Diplonema papillatum]
MGVCGTKEPDRSKKPPKMDAQQAKVNEASKIVKQQVKDDVRNAAEEASKLEEEANAAPEENTGKKDEDPEKKAEKKKKAKRKAKYAKKHLLSNSAWERRRVFPLSVRGCRSRSTNPLANQNLNCEIHHPSNKSSKYV